MTGTVVQRFYPHTDDWDGTDPASGDVRALNTSLPAATSGSNVQFGTSGAKEITVDPYTSGRTTTGVDSAFGWAIDIAGADGMDSTATAKRVIPAGTWFYQGWLSASPVASLNAVTVGFYVYRVAAAPSTTRTLLFSDSVSAGLVSTAGTAFTRTTGAQSEILLEAGETIQVTITLSGTGQIGGLDVDYRTGDQTTDCLIDVPTPGVRTEYLQSVSVTATGTAAVTVGTKTVTGVIYDSSGAPVDGATAKLFRQSDDVKISTDTTGADGVYLFTRADDDAEQWYVVGFSDDTHHGTTDRSLSAT